MIAAGRHNACDLIFVFVFLFFDVVRAYFDKIAVFGDLDLDFIAVVLLGVRAKADLAVFRFLFNASDGAAGKLCSAHFLSHGGKQEGSFYSGATRDDDSVGS